jgi:4'-phosphopantetheinyl transferase
VALTRKTPVGVDLERRRPLEDVLGLARHVLSEREQSQLRSYAPERREAVFFSFWTRKEAWLKAHGHGLVFGAARLEVTLDPDRDPEVVAIDGVRPAADGWSLVDLDPPAGYRAALAVVGPRPRVEYVDDPYDGPPAEEER